MKLSVYYESNFKSDYTWFETEEDSVNVMIDRDYQERLADSDGTEPVERRDPQTILDEEISKPTYNSNHKDARRSVVYSALDPYGKIPSRAQNPEDAYIAKEDKRALHAALKKLPARQRKLLEQIYWDQMSQREIADAENVKENSLSDRKKRALAALKKILEKM